MIFIRVLLFLSLLQSTVALGQGIEVNGEIKGALLENMADDPACTESRIYWNTGEKKAKVCSGEAWTGLGSGAGSGGVNYIGSPDSDIGWEAHGSGITISTTTTASELPNAGFDIQALKLVNAGSGTGGHSYCFRVGERYKNHLLGLTANVRCDGTDYTKGDFTYRIVSDTAADCSGTETDVRLMGVGTDPVDLGVQKIDETFLATTADYYQLYFERAAGSAGWCTLSGVTVGPGVVGEGAVLSEEVEYTPTLTSGTVTYTQQDGRWRQVGSNMELSVDMTLNTVSSAPGASWGINLPTGHNVDTERMASDAMRGAGAVFDVSAADAARFIPARLRYSSGLGTGAIQVTQYNDQAFPTLAAGDIIEFTVSVPILEWRGKGTTRMLSNSDIYANARARYTGLTADTISNSANADITWSTEDYAEGISHSSSEFVVPVDGKYRIDAQVRLSAIPGGIVQCRVLVNTVSRAIKESTSKTQACGGSLNLLAGDVLKINIVNNSGSSITTVNDANISFVEISRISDTTHSDGRGLGLATATDPGLYAAGQAPGTATNDDADAGNVGEYIESKDNAGVTWPTASTSSGNVGSITLTPGDWDVSFVMRVTGGTVTGVSGWIATASASTTGRELGSNYFSIAAAGTVSSIPNFRISVTSNTQIWLVGNLTYSSAPTVMHRLSARRVR